MDFKVIGDYHTHTNIPKGNFVILHKTFGEHARGSILQNSVIAIKKGMKEIAVTDHGEQQILYGMKKGLYKSVRQEIDEINNMFFEKKIDFRVLLGIEANITNKNGDIDVDDSIIDYLDLICAGYHRGCVNELNLKKNITEAIINVILKNNIAILNHPCDHINPDIIEIGKAASARNTALEINRKHKNLSIEEIKKLKETGAIFSLGSDSHYSKDVGSFGAAYELAIESGLTNDDLINADGIAHRKVNLLKKETIKLPLNNMKREKNNNIPLNIIFLSGKKVIIENKDNLSSISFNKEALENLKEIVEKTKSYIIITSSIRKVENGYMILKSELSKYGLSENLIGYTSEKIGSRRDKIQITLNNLGQYVDKYIILDSRDDFGVILNKHLITCNNGIDNIIKNKVIKALL